MSLFGQAKAWLRAVGRRSAVEREMQLEMESHIEQAAARFVARGMSEREALYAARREFGTVSAIQESARDSRGGRFVHDMTTDIRYALRYFARTPLTSVTIVFTLMLGIGVNAAVYSFAQGYLYNPPPGVPGNPALVLLQGTERYNGRPQTRSFSYAEMTNYSAQPVFSSVAGWSQSSVVLDVGDAADGVVSSTALYVTPNYFSTLGVRLVAGAGFVETNARDNASAEFTVVLAHSLAVAQFGTAADAIGKKLRVNDAIVTVVGVAPPRFSGTNTFSNSRLLFMPMSAMQTVEHIAGESFTNPDSSLFQAVAVLNAGVAREQAQAVAASIGARHAAMRQPDEHLTGATTHTPTLRGLNAVDNRPGQAIAVTLLFGTLDVLILLVCITTVSSLLVGAAITRRHEMGVRLALGASRWRIVRQLITETTILAWVGAVAGLLLYYALTRAAFVARIPIDVVPTWHAAIFTATFAVVVALLCGLSPALHATRLGLSDVLKSASGGATQRSRLQQSFVVAQIAFAQPLLVILALTIISLVSQTTLRKEVTLSEHLIVAQFNRYAGRGMGNGEAALTAVSQRLVGIPGVSGVVARPNILGLGTVRVIELNGKLSTAKAQPMRVNYISTQYMDLVGIKLLAGRQFVWADTLERVKPIVVRADFAANAFGGGNPIGRRLCQYSCNRPTDTLEIVGVASASWEGLTDRGERLNALALNDGKESSSLLIRTSVDARAVVPAIRTIAREEAPMLPLSSVATIAELDAKERETFVQASSATAGAGALTLFFACVGLYAVVALAVGQRRREIGIRIALGARPSTVVALFFRGGLKLSVIGLLIGLPLSAAGVRIFGARVMGRMEGDPVLIAAGIAIIVLLVASLATWLPARKAAAVDPLAALRAD